MKKPLLIAAVAFVLVVAAAAIVRFGLVDGSSSRVTETVIIGGIRSDIVDMGPVEKECEIELRNYPKTHEAFFRSRYTDCELVNSSVGTEGECSQYQFGSSPQGCRICELSCTLKKGIEPTNTQTRQTPCERITSDQECKARIDCLPVDYCGPVTVRERARRCEKSTSEDRICNIGGFSFCTALRCDDSNMSDQYYANLRALCTDDCCRFSVDAMRAGEYRLAPSTGCGNNYQQNGLECINSYSWCEPITKRYPSPTN